MKGVVIMAVKILIDSAADISKAEAETLGIEMISIDVQIDDTIYQDGITLLPNDFYQKLSETTTLPKTSQINPYRYEQEFKRLVTDGDELICITLSSKLSGTYNNALTASMKFEGKVYVIDSLNASLGERLLCEYAIQLVNRGLNAKEIANELEMAKHKVNFYALIDTLEYLRRGGRVSAVAAVAGEILSIKPIIAVVGGEIKVIAKAVGSRRGNNVLNTFVERKGGIDYNLPYGMIFSGNDSSKFVKYHAESEKFYKERTKDFPVYHLGATVGTHIGPGGVGIAFFEK